MNPAVIEKLREWRLYPVKFVRECFGVEPDEWQKDILENFPYKNRIGMKACKGPGKTAVEAWCAWNFLATRPHPKIAATSITKENLSDNLWSEMSKWQKKSEFLTESFTWTKTRIFANDHPETWWMSARTWSKSADKEQQADTLAGLHADYLLFILDEVGGIPDAVMAAAEGGLATGVETKILMGGNPTHLEGPLYRACTNERHLWHMVEITSDPNDPKRTPRVSLQWAKDQIDKYGKDNPWVLVNVFGKFPPSSINTLIGPDEVYAAMKMTYQKDVYEWAQKRLGIDVARFGDDLTVIFPRQGLVAFRPADMRHARDSAPSVEIANRVMKAKQQWGSNWEAFDDTVGWAHGAIDVMRSSGHGPRGVMFHGKAIDPRYKNRRAEMWIEMVNWIRRGGCLPNIPELVAELTTPTYCYKEGVFWLEAKDQIKDRLGRSPNFADALALTFAEPDATGEIHNLPGGPFEPAQKKMESEYEPFDPSRQEAQKGEQLKSEWDPFASRE